MKKTMKINEKQMKKFEEVRSGIVNADPRSVEVVIDMLQEKVEHKYTPDTQLLRKLWSSAT